jgi:cytochrome b561
MEPRKYTLVFRIMHWSIALTMLFMLLTIFLRLGWMNKFQIAEITGPYLLEQGVELSDDQLILLAKKIRKPMWDWHIWSGYLLMGLYVIRMSLPFFGVMKFMRPNHKQATGKEHFEAWTYIVFYALVGVSLVTGFLIVNGPKEYKGDLEGVHELSIYYFMAFIVLHFGGILMAEFGAKKGIISRIVSGERAGAAGS